MGGCWFGRAGTFIALVGLQGAGIRKAFRFTEKNEVPDTTLLRM
jgi:hypothetical protein